MEIISHAATVLIVSDMNASLAFYTDKLGFSVNFTWNDPIDYVVLKRGDVNLHLTQGIKPISNHKPTPILYLFVHDVNTLAAEFRSKSVDFHTEPGSREYGMTDFDVLDPDGYLITFGKGN